MLAKKQEHKPYLDILRILASFLVCYNHAYAFHLFLDQEPNGSLVSWINIFLSVLTTINIPLFFMISGALLLGRTESYKELYSKRIWRIIILIIFASAVTYFIIPPEEFSFKHFLYQFFSGRVNGSHWYLFAYLSFLLMLPFMRRIAVSLTNADMLNLILIRTVLIPGVLILNLLLSRWNIQPIVLSANLRAPLATFEFIFYPITGYYLSEKVQIDQVKPKQICFWILVLICGSTIAAWATYAEGKQSAFSQTYLGLFNYTSAIAVFLFIRYKFEKICLSERLQWVLSSISSVTIGIFLLEPIVVHYLYTPFFAPIPWTSVHITFFSVLWCILCMTTGGTVTYLLRKIPGVKKYL